MENPKNTRKNSINANSNTITDCHKGSNFVEEILSEYHMQIEESNITQEEYCKILGMNWLPWGNGRILILGNKISDINDVLRAMGRKEM